MMFYRTFPLLSAVGVALLCAGCDDQNKEIKVYRVAKADAETPNSPAGGDMPSSPVAPQLGMPGMGSAGTVPAMGVPGAEAAPQIVSTPPASWIAQPASSMRLASFQIKGENGAVADISLIALGGAAGGALENVNRWLGQLGQPAVSQEKLTQMTKHLTMPLGDVMIVDLEGLPAGADPAKDGRILAAIVTAGDRTLFFKLRGNAALASSRKNEFLQWVETVRLN